MTWIVTGGAGYIGSVTSNMLAREGHEVLILDDLSKGHREAVRGFPLEQVDIEDKEAVESCCQRYEPEACVHFAARSLVGESVAQPLMYFRTNVLGTINLLGALVGAKCRLMVFSSTAAVYGEPPRSPIVESDPTEPINPYGVTKLAVERMLAELGRTGEIRHVALRYFNAAGADTEAGLGEDHDPETHLIPKVIASAQGREPRASIFGTDYPTPDGTCVRDYIHVLDLARAHVLGIEHLAGDGETGAFNLGNGEGFSVREVISAVEGVSGRGFPVVEEPRREGDPPVLVASSERIRSVLGWAPGSPGLEDIVGSAWQWHEAHPAGYSG
jgi:UDP-glucose 4-epimerase